MNDVYSAPLWIEIDRIDLRPASEVRVLTNDEAIDDYAASFDELPPIRLICEGEDTHWTADGSHRVRAAIKLGKDRIRAQIRKGTYLDAFTEACAANDKHGIKTTNADKRRRVEVALAHPTMTDWSNNHIADYCGVSHTTVDRIRPSTDVAQNATSRVDTLGRRQPARKPRKPKVSAPVETPRDEPKPETNGESVAPTQTPKPDPEPEPEPRRDSPPDLLPPRLSPAPPPRFNVTDAFDVLEDMVLAALAEWPERYHKDFGWKLYAFAVRFCSEKGIVIKEVSRGA